MLATVSGCSVDYLEYFHVPTIEEKTPIIYDKKMQENGDL